MDSISSSTSSPARKTINPVGRNAARNGSKAAAAAESAASTPVARAMETIESMIATGKLVPGQRLVEADLSEETGIARGRVREALRILSGSGIVELVPFKGARVKRLEQSEVSALFRTIAGLYSTAIVSLSFEYPHLSAADRRRFQAVSRNQTRIAKQGSFKKLIGAHNEYMAETNRLCENPHIEKLMSQLRMTIFFRHFANFVPEALIRDSMAMADQVLEGVMEGNPTKTIATVWKSIEPIAYHLMSGTSDRQTRSP